MGPRGDRPLENVTTRAPGSAWPVAARTLTEALAWHVDEHPDLVTLRLLCGHDGSAVEELTYATLAAEAEGCARALSAEGIGRGERVAVMLPPGRGFFVDFLGTLPAGGVPVPLYPPIRPAELEAHLGRQARLLDDAGASVLIAEAEPSAAEQILGPLVPSLRSVRTPAMLRDPGGTPLKLLVPGEDDTALIQYTSGSTGDPRGAVLTHAQLLANVRALGRAAAVNTDDVFVSWLPQYHDMGLIGAWHAMLYFGFPLVDLAGIDLRVQGCLPPTGSPAVIVSNHSSFVDAAVLLLASRDPVDFVTSTDLERNRLAGPLLRRLGCVFVQRDRADRSVEEVAESVRLVDGGHRLVVFPEGSITRAPGLRAFRLGAFTIAAAAGCPVVPVGIRGTRDIVRPGTYLPRRGAVEVVVGVPILATGDDFAGHVDLAERARRAVGELSREPQVSWEPPPATPASR
jgi:1-acyl-sn-glycerol-3-phosphate acyltransferase